jgi:hypothetical protein
MESEDYAPLTSGTGGTRREEMRGFHSAASGLLTGAFVVAEPFIKAWVGEHYLKEKWAAEERKMVSETITRSSWKYQVAYCRAPS